MRLTFVNYLFIFIISIEASFWIAHTLEGSPDHGLAIGDHLENSKNLWEQQPEAEGTADPADAREPPEAPISDVQPPDELLPKHDPLHSHSEHRGNPHETLHGGIQDGTPSQTRRKGHGHADTKENEQSYASYSYALLALVMLAILAMAFGRRARASKKAGAKPRASDVGIVAMEVCFPRCFVKQADLETFDDASTGKYTIGLGQLAMAVPQPAEDVTSLALTAVQSLMDKWEISPDQVGRIEVGTETLTDYSKSIKTSLLQLFGSNTSIEGVSSINACYGGTAALFNSVAWVESSAWDGRYALVVAVDIALYEPGPARPTGGASAVAMLVGPDAALVLEPERATFSAHTYDFYKPCRADPSEYPLVDGKLSNECYIRAIDSCYAQFAQKMEDRLGRPWGVSDIEFMAFHAPYNKLVRKSFARLFWGDQKRTSTPDSGLAPFLELSDEASLTDRALEKHLVALSKDAYDRVVAPAAALGRQVGNSYTGSLYNAVASLVSVVPAHHLACKNIMLFSYGSGAVASMFSLRVRGDLKPFADKLDIQSRLADRLPITPEHYTELLSERSAGYGKPVTPAVPLPGQLFGGSFYVSSVDDQYRRQYARAEPHTSDPALNAELNEQLSAEFTFTPMTNAPVSAKKSKWAKFKSVLAQLAHPVECAALARFLRDERRRKKAKALQPCPDLDEAFCFEILNRVSRSFAAVIETLPGETRKEVCIFYLVLRALDTVEDDMTIAHEPKKKMLREFATYLRRPTIDFAPIAAAGYGDTDDYRELVRRYDSVLRVFAKLSPGAQSVIEDITIRMAEGMADFVGSTRVTSHSDYELYCHYVAGLVGIGLSKLWELSPEEAAPWSSPEARDHLSNEMGLFLQKTNITRDYREDIDVDRLFWPKEVWSRYAANAEAFTQSENESDGLACLNDMITDALGHVPKCLEYLEHLSDPKIFRFCAIPQVMAIATLNVLYNNPRVLHSEVKIRKGKAVWMIQRASSMEQVRAIFYKEALELKHNICRSDPSAERTAAAVEAILELTAPKPSPWTSRLLSTFVDGTLLITFATGVHRLSVCSKEERCNLLGADGLMLLMAAFSVHMLRIVKGDQWVAQALGYERAEEQPQPASPKRTQATVGGFNTPLMVPN